MIADSTGKEAEPLMKKKTLTSYIGCKIIKAEPMSSCEFNSKIKGVPNIENCENAPGYLVVYPDGYKSWSPKNVFEEAYRKISVQEEKLIFGLM